MIESKFERFTRENTPQPLTVPAERVARACATIGLKTEQVDGRWVIEIWRLPVDDTGAVQVSWYRPAGAVGGYAEYTPTIKNVGWDYGDNIAKVLGELGVYPAKVRLPEPVVRLPIPDWVFGFEDEGHIQTLFVSEAEEAVATFVQAAQAEIVAGKP